jgi:hypothetical protein
MYNDVQPHVNSFSPHVLRTDNRNHYGASTHAMLLLIIIAVEISVS